jgi:hypothetical protein
MEQPIYVFTGTRDLPPGWLDPLREYVESLPAGVAIVGACVGWDAVVARYAHLYHRVHAVVPGIRGKWFDPCWRSYCSTYEVMPEGSSFKARDARMVLRGAEWGGKGALCVAGPLHPEDAPEARGSGTWLTVRLARAADLRIEIPEFVRAPA